MITFGTLRWSNFLSTGNEVSEIRLDDISTTLIVGGNGAGKSTMLDALSFALFGKAHRSISKPQLVNSINKKACLVEVTFNVNGSDYLVRRGIKPNIFEIHKDGTLINQSSHAKDYQNLLEQNILKLNHKSFHQIVVLGSSSFVPFMQLSAAHRREVIEDLLDINVFSKMNSILKEKQSGLRSKIKDVLHALEINKTKQEGQERYIFNVSQRDTEAKKEKSDLIDQYNSEVLRLTQENTDMSSQLDGMTEQVQKKSTLEKTIQEYNNYKTKFTTQATAIVKDLKFFEVNDTCPTCTQQIDPSVKDEKAKAAKEKATKLQSAIVEADTHITSAQEALSEVVSHLDTFREVQSKMNANNQLIQRLQRDAQRTTSELQSLNEDHDLEEAKQTLQTLVDEALGLSRDSLKMNEEYNYNIVMAEMLKDTGIKTKIVKQYIPVINKVVNDYLQTLDFFVSFTLDESFDETIRSRHRDDFSYASFSEGEKQRIDLALLFTWRQIARMRNSVATNILILDETFDSSLDNDGIDNLMKIIYTLSDDTNVFVISHKGEMLEDKFKRKIEVVKDKNFSKLT